MMNLKSVVFVLAASLSMCAGKFKFKDELAAVRVDIPIIAVVDVAVMRATRHLK